MCVRAAPGVAACAPPTGPSSPSGASIARSPAPERLVFTYRTESAGVSDPETVVTLTFADLGNHTRLTLRHTAFDSDAARLDHQGGWTGALERLTAFIATAGAAP